MQTVVQARVQISFVQIGEMRTRSPLLSWQLRCQPSIRTKRKIRKVLCPQTGNRRQVAKGQNAPSVGRNTRFGAALPLRKPFRSCLQRIEIRTVSANLRQTVFLAIAMHSG